MMQLSAKNMITEHSQPSNSSSLPRKSLHFIFYHGTLQNCKKYCASVVILISFLIVFQSYGYIFTLNKKLNFLPMIGIETDSSLLVSMIYEHRSRTLTDKCNYSYTSVFDVSKSAPASLIQAYPWLNAAIFPLESKSLMYCAVPKIASKTLISLIIYVYVRDITDYINNTLADIDVNRTRAEQLINIPKLIEQLRKNGILIPNTKESISVTSLLQTYLNILRFESINSTSPSLYLNPWRLSLNDVFPAIHFKSISNISNLFSSYFTRAMFVRHPFERLASAYKERIATLGKDRIQPEPHYDTVRRMICRWHRRFDSRQNPLERRNLCEDFIPTFEHFVQYILMNTETPAGIARMDAHWKPYTVVCQVCEFKYNFIGKYETFNDDLTSLLKLLNVSDWNIQKRRGASGHTTWNYQQLFSSLPDNLICRLKNLYKDDFQLFNYRLEDYVNRTTLIC